MNKRSDSFSSVSEGWLDRFIQKWRFGIIIPFINKGIVVCDLGCGKNGDFLKKISSIISKGTGVDGHVGFSEEGNITLKIADLNSRLPLDDNSFDVVTSLAVLEHLENPEGFLLEANRILKSDGKLLLTTPSPGAKIILEALAIIGLISKEEINDHKHYFSIKELRVLAQKHGYKKIETRIFQLGLNNLLIATK